MKLFIILFSLLTSFPLNDFYALQLDGLDGQQIQTTAFKGKKVLIAVLHAADLDTGQVNYLDSIQVTNSNLQVVVVPTDEFKSRINTAGLKAIQKSAHFLMTKPLKVKKNDSVNQHPLFSWLTHWKRNGHFDHDVDVEGQLFVVSEKGTLYSVISLEAPHSTINKIVTQSFDD